MNAAHRSNESRARCTAARSIRAAFTLAAVAAATAVIPQLATAATEQTSSSSSWSAAAGSTTTTSSTTNASSASSASGAGEQAAKAERRSARAKSLAAKGTAAKHPSKRAQGSGPKAGGTGAGANCQAPSAKQLSAHAKTEQAKAKHAKNKQAKSKQTKPKQPATLCLVIPGKHGSHKPRAHHRTKPSPSKPTATHPTQPALPPATPATSLSSLFPTLPAAVTTLESSAVNLLIGVFPVPPFLLPIYHAAGLDYGVPWEVLAAINEIETDYGRNLSTSSAGAVGWMQFLPSTWASFGVDADGNGKPNPNDPMDAIFAAARYLNAAGAEHQLARAIFAYNHANWYVTSVELRASLLQFLPQGVIDVLTGLMQASYPVAGDLGAYAERAPALTRVGGKPAVRLSAPAKAPVIAVADGRVVAIGQNERLGRYVTLQDSYGDRFTYSGLGSLASVYPQVKPRVQSRAQLARELGLTTASAGRALPAATKLASFGSSTGEARTSSASKPAATSAPAQSRATVPVAMPKERLFANPSRPASYAAGGKLQLKSSVTRKASSYSLGLQSSLRSYAAGTDVAIGGPGRADYFSKTVALRPSQFRLARLRRGSIVVAGTVLGRVAPSATGAPGITFQLVPAGSKVAVDPRSIITGWELLGRLTAGRSSALVGASQAGAYGAGNSSLGQLLLGSRAQLQRAVLSDRRIALSRCARADVAAGSVDRRVLAVLEYLSYSRLAPAVTGMPCGAATGRREGSITQVEITRLDGIAVAGHQRDGGIVDLAIRRLLGLQGQLRPSQIISLRSYPWQSTTLALPDHAAQIEIDFSQRGAAAGGTGLDSAQWKKLIGRLTQLGA
jgi:hypothetical protein